MKIEEIIKKYGKDKDHAYNVAKISVLLFQKLKILFPHLLKYDNKKDLNLLKNGALLHDIGIFFEKIYDKEHHKAGAKFILENKPDDVEDNELIILCCLIRYHRKNLPDKKKHKLYALLNKEDKLKLDYLAPIIRLADSLDTGHLNLISDVNFEYSKKLNILTLKPKVNIMLNTSILSAANRKKDFFEKVFKVKLKIKED